MAERSRISETFPRRVAVLFHTQIFLRHISWQTTARQPRGVLTYDSYGVFYQGPRGHVT